MIISVGDEGIVTHLKMGHRKGELGGFGRTRTASSGVPETPGNFAQMHRPFPRPPKLRCELTLGHGDCIPIKEVLSF